MAKSATGVGVFDWRPEISGGTGAVSIGSDLILIDKPVITSIFDHPFKTDVVTAVICEKGEVKGEVNLVPYHYSGPNMIVIFPDQILRYDYISPDFQGVFIVMSKRFLDSLDLNVEATASVFMRDHPCVPLGPEGLGAMMTYYNMMRRVISVEDHPNKLEIAKNLTRAFFFGAGYYFHKIPRERDKSKNEKLVGEFLKLVRENYRRHRDLEFYSGRLSLTPKYLSSVVGRTSGKTAGEWIDDHVVLEAKALLKSTGMTIQQIGDELGFPSQSFFGKYFKRHTGLSPKEYRRE
jgi:AraC-like DNA-binding protein